MWSGNRSDGAGITFPLVVGAHVVGAQQFRRRVLPPYKINYRQIASFPYACLRIAGFAQGARAGNPRRVRGLAGFGRPICNLQLCGPLQFFAYLEAVSAFRSEEIHRRMLSLP